MKKILSLLLALIFTLSLLTSCSLEDVTNIFTTTAGNVSTTVKDTPAISPTDESITFTISGRTFTIPVFQGKAWIELNGMVPFFTDAEKKSKEPFETFTPLDSLGRCGVAYANVCRELMPTEARGDIGSVKPSGWQSIRYDCVDGKYLYNRCHLIGFQLTGENANKQNLITGTRYLNIDGMLEFENMVADYVKETNNHVLYRVSPIFEGNNLVCIGLVMEAYSVEDKGEGIEYCVFSYNAQPHIYINYADGTSTYIEGYGVSVPATTSSQNSVSTTENNTPVVKVQYVLNTSSLKFHNPTCGSINSISESNKKDFYGTRDELIEQGYSPCGSCKP